MKSLTASAAVLGIALALVMFVVAAVTIAFSEGERTSAIALAGVASALLMFSIWRWPR